MPEGLALQWRDGDPVVSERGERLRGRGVLFHDGDGFAYAWDSRRLREDFGVHVFKVAGVTYRPDALRLDRFDVGRRVRLVPEPDNPHDPDAIAVRDADGRHQVGYVPRDATRRIRGCVDRGDPAIVFHQWRLEDGTRSGLRVLAAPEPVVAAVESFVRARERR